MSGMSANNTKIFYKTGAATEFTEIPYIMDVPEFGGAPEKVDVTTLSDKVKKFVPGIIDLGDLDFQFLYDNSTATSNYRVLKGLQDTHTMATFKITYPDSTAHQFDAYVSVKMDEGAINGALTFTCSVQMQSDITVTNPTTGA